MPIFFLNNFFKESALGRFCHKVAMSVCLFVPFHVLDFEAYIAPTWMSKNFRDSEFLGKSAGKKWSQNWTLLLGSGLKLPRNKKFVFCWFCLILRGRTGVEPILLHAWRPINKGWVRGHVDASTASFFFSFFLLDKSRKLSKIVLVLQFASVERFNRFKNA